jgi:DNA gyrase subunit B
VISIKMASTKLQFEGQTKGKLGNTEVEGIVKSIVGDTLTTFFEENPDHRQKHLRKNHFVRRSPRSRAQSP